MSTGGNIFRRSLVFAVVGLLSGQIAATSQLTHGWDCITCETNSMLAGDFGHNAYTSTMFNLSDTWWIDTIAKSYAAVTLNIWLGSEAYNGTGEIGLVTVARALKAANPKIKVLFYQNTAIVAPNQYVQNQLVAHPEWWRRDDYGNILYWRAPTLQQPHGFPFIDLSVPDAQVFFYNLTFT